MNIPKPLENTLLEHCAASIKQGVFANVTASLLPQFSPEVVDLAKKSVFVVQPRGILPVPKSVTALPAESSAFSVIDEERILQGSVELKTVINRKKSCWFNGA